MAEHEFIGNLNNNDEVPLSSLSEMTAGSKKKTFKQRNFEQTHFELSYSQCFTS
jgi:hypothetical protein